MIHILTMSTSVTFQCVKPTKLSWTGSITTSDGKVHTSKDRTLPLSNPLSRLLPRSCVGSSIKTDTALTHKGKTLMFNGTLTAE